MHPRSVSIGSRQSVYGNRAWPGACRWLGIGAVGLLLPALAGCELVASLGDGAARLAGKVPGREVRAAVSPPAAPRDPLVVPATDDLRARVKTQALAPVPYRETLRVAASLQVDETRLARVGSAVSGRVMDIHAQVGDAVRPGQRLAVLASTDLANAQMNYLQALAQQQLHQRAVERAQLLLGADVIAPADLQRRQADLASAEAAVKAGRDFLRNLGMSEAGVRELTESRDIRSAIPIVSTRHGLVIERKVTAGQVLQPADPAFTIADLSRLWMVADVPEQLAGTLRVGERVDAEVPALGDRRLRGRLDFVAALVNPETRTIRVRMSVDNVSGDLKPAMLATMLIEGPETRPLGVPSTAVVRENDADHVYVERADGGWRMLRVKLGAEHNGVRPVLDGLQPGAKVAVDGAFHLNAARKAAATQS